MLFDIDTHNEESISNAIDRLIEFKNELNKIHVGDTVKVIDTGKVYTTHYSFFQDALVMYDKNSAMARKIVELSARYDYGTSWYEDGIKSLKDEFRVEYIANNGLERLAVITKKSANSNHRKSYLIDIDGLERW